MPQIPLSALLAHHRLWEVRVGIGLLAEGWRESSPSLTTLSSAGFRRRKAAKKKLGAHKSVARVRTAPYKTTGYGPNSKEKNAAADGGGPMTLSPTDGAALPADRNNAARYPPTKPASDAGRPAKLRTHHVDKVVGGWFPCTWLQRKVCLF